MTNGGPPARAALRGTADRSLPEDHEEILGLPNPGERAKALLRQDAYDAACREGTALSLDAVVAESRAV